MRKPFTPRAYQGMATEHMLNVPRCALWAGMGLGKSASTLNVVDALQLAGESDPVLVLAPLRVARTRLYCAALWPGKPRCKPAWSGGGQGPWPNLRAWSGLILLRPPCRPARGWCASGRA